MSFVLRATTACAALAFASGCAFAQGADLAWSVGADLSHRKLVEYSAAGARLVTESGPMARLRIGVQQGLASGGAWGGGAALGGGDLDYEGVTQAGVPLSTRSRHRDAELSAFWQPWPAADWGQATLTLRWLQQRRDIMPTATVAGLEETSSLWIPGLRYSTPVWTAGAALRWQLEAEASVSARHRLRVDYGGVFDGSNIRGATRRELALRVHAFAAESPWRWTLEWTGSRQPASPVATLYRNGAAVGTVRQPRIAIDEVALRLTRSF
jgi:hypothetical protein